MTFQQELSSWNPFSKPQSEVKPVPEVGIDAPSTALLKFPRSDQKPTIIAFLRHCGCPFAEKVFRKLRDASTQNPNIHCIAISHSDQASTDKWVQDVGGAGNIEVLVDFERQSFAAYGLTASSFWAVLNPWSMSNVLTLGREEGIWNKPTQSGSRWQTAGLFATNGAGKVVYSHPAQTSDDLGDVNVAIEATKN